MIHKCVGKMWNKHILLIQLVRGSPSESRKSACKASYKFWKFLVRNFASIQSFWFCRDVLMFSGAMKSIVGSESSVLFCSQHLFNSSSHAIFTHSWLTLLFCLLQVPTLETEVWETDILLLCLYFSSLRAESTQLKHLIWTSQLILQF